MVLIPHSFYQEYIRSVTVHADMERGFSGETHTVMSGWCGVIRLGYTDEFRGGEPQTPVPLLEMVEVSLVLGVHRSDKAQFLFIIGVSFLYSKLKQIKWCLRTQVIFSRCPSLDRPPHPNVLRFGTGCLSHCVKAGSRETWSVWWMDTTLRLVNSAVVMDSLRNQFSNLIE